MKINILRGQNQIGGSIIEVKTETTRIFLDAGANMEESKRNPFVPHIEGLFRGNPDCDGVFISHYHSDHMGLLTRVLDGVPIYMGRGAYNVKQAIAEYKGRTLGFTPILLDAGVPVTVGDITVTPVPCDHSAFESFMFLVSSSGKSLLYTADFRSTGRPDYDVFLEGLPSVDVLVCEGTNLNWSEDYRDLTEEELEELAAKMLVNHSGPAIIYLSALNVERIITAHNAARRSGRRFIMDELSAVCAEAAGIDIDGYVLRISHSLRDLGEIVAAGLKANRRTKRHVSARFPAISPRKAFASPDFLLAMTPQNLINFRRVARRMSFKDGVFFFGRRETDLLKPAASAFFSLMKSLGAVCPILHTSGHADVSSIDRLVRTVDPSVIIPVHTENPDWFSCYEEEHQVIYDCSDYEI